mgnify:CR=1 FL=1
MRAVFGGLPLVPRPHQPPGLAGIGDRILARQQQFVTEELATQSDVIGDAHGLLEALGPDGLDLLDLGPCADAFDPDLLSLLELRARHT